MHGMDSGSVPTLMLALFKIVKELISANMRSSCVAHQFLKQKVVVSTQELSFGMKVCIDHACITMLL